MGAKLDLLLVRPSDRKGIYGNLASDVAAIEPPLWALLLAAYARERGCSVAVLDMDVEGLGPAEAAARIQAQDPLVVGLVVTGNHLSASTWNMVGARRLLEALAATGRMGNTFLWGLHPSALPERTLREEQADLVVQGEGFQTIAALVEALRSGRSGFLEIPGLWQRRGEVVVGSERAPLIGDLDSLPMPAWDLIPVARYRAHNWQCFDDLERRSPYAAIYTSLGCPMACKFCSLKTLSGKRGVRFRNPERVLEEIDLLVNTYGVRNIKILDECFVLNKKHVRRICELIIERGYQLNMWAYARVDIVDEQLLQLMKRAGLSWLCYGIEAANLQVRQGVRKDKYQVDQIRSVIRKTKDAGICILANFMLGLPDDNQQTMEETLRLALELNCEYTNFYATMAYPGSDLYDEVVAQGIRLPETWAGYSQFNAETLPLPTRHLSAAEVLRFRDRAFRELHGSPRYQEMVGRRFGPHVVAHLRQLLSHSIERKHA